MAIARQNVFFSSKTRLKRANQHIRRLEKRIKRFFETVPHSTIIETDADGGGELHKIRFAKPFPESIDVAATEAAQALRDVLDYCGAAAASAAGVANPTSAKFPFGAANLGTRAECRCPPRLRCKNALSRLQTIPRRE